MTVDDCIACERLLLRAKELIGEAVWQHIYNADNGERPDSHCAYLQWLKDCDRFLVDEEAAV